MILPHFYAKTQCVLTFAAATLVGAASASAQPPATPPTGPANVKVLASSANVAALIAKAKHDHKPGQALVIEPLRGLPRTPPISNTARRSAPPPSTYMRTNLLRDQWQRNLGYGR